MGVRQANRTIPEVTFATTFSPLRHSCHTVNSFAATVEPGAYEIVTTYNRATGDNFWAGLSSTDGGLTFDVQIVTARPPFATGPQGPIQIRGVGINTYWVFASGLTNQGIANLVPHNKYVNDFRLKTWPLP